MTTYDYDNLCGGGHSDKDEMDFPEEVAAQLSPFKNGAQATISVIIFEYSNYFKGPCLS